ncbi:hypothetical protein BH11PSE4_BH11PSE4_06530 [soil metagenome]
MAQGPSFSDAAVQAAISSAKSYYDDRLQKGLHSGLGVDDGHLSTLAECVTLTVSNGQACLNLPLGIGHVCLPVPVSYDGKVASACLSICTTWGIPTGVRVTVTVAGVTIVSKSFGKC